MSITVTCKCGRVMKVPDSYAGKKGRCPRCSETIDIPLSTGLEIDDSELLLDDAGPPSETRAAEAAQRITATGRICPRCKSKVPGTEEHCPNCGANYVMASRQIERKLAEAEAKKRTGKGRSRSSLFRIAVAGVIAVSLAVVSILVFTGDDKETGPPRLGKETAKKRTSTASTGEKTSSTTPTAAAPLTAAKTGAATATATATAQAVPRLVQEVEYLLQELAEADAEGRAKAIALLAEKGRSGPQGRAAGRLIEKGLKHENADVRTGALEALAKILGDRAVSCVNRMLSDSDPSVRRYAADMARKFPSHEKMLLVLVGDEDAGLAGEIALYLVLKDYKPAASRVSRVLEMRGLENISPRMAVAALTCDFRGGTGGSIQALESDDPAIRKAAIAALEKVYGTARGYDPSASPEARKGGVESWKGWWKKRTTFNARMTVLVRLVREEERLRRGVGRGRKLDEYHRTFWRLLVERWRIVEMGADAVPGLSAGLDRKVFRGTDRLRADESLRLLGAIGGVAAVIPIFQVAKNPNHPKRSKAVSALGKVGEAGAKALLKLLEEKPKGLDISEIFRALGRTGSKSAIPTFRAALESSEVRERYAAFSALAHLGETDAAVKYFPELNDLRRTEIRELLVRSASPDLAKALIERIGGENQPEEVKPALTLLGEVGGADAGKYLQQLLKKGYGGLPLTAIVEAAARLNIAKLASTVLEAVEPLNPEEKEEAYSAFLYFDAAAAFQKIFQNAVRGDRFACQLLPELAKRGYTKAKTAARNVATKGRGIARIAGIRALGYTGDRLTTRKLWKNRENLFSEGGGFIDPMIELVGRVQLTDAINVLVKNLETGERVRLSLDALGRMSDPAAEKVLIERMAVSRRLSLEALALNPSERLVAVFGEVLQDQSAHLNERLTAAYALGKIGAEDAVNDLRTALADPKPELRAAAAASLGVLGDVSVAPYLVTLVLDDDLQVRREAMFSLARLGNYLFVSELMDELEYVNPSSKPDRDFRDRVLEALAAKEKKADASFRSSSYATARSRISALAKLRAYFNSRLKSLPRNRKYSAEPPVPEGFAVRRGLGEITKKFAKVLKKFARGGVSMRGPGKPLDAEWESKKINLPHLVYGMPAVGDSHIAAFLEIPPEKPKKPPIVKPKEGPKPTYKLVVYDIKEDSHCEVSPVLEAPRSSLCIREGALFYFQKTAPDNFDRAANMTVCEGELRRYDLAKREDEIIWEAPLVEEPVAGPVISKNYCVIATPRAIRVLDFKKQEETALADRVDESVFKLGKFTIHGQVVWWKRHYLDKKVQSWCLDIRRLEKKEFDMAFLPDFTGSRAVNVLGKRIEIWDYSRGQIDAIYAAADSHVVDGKFCYFTAGGALFVLDTASAKTARILDNVDTVAGVTPHGVVAARGGSLLLVSPK